MRCLDTAWKSIWSERRKQYLEPMYGKDGTYEGSAGLPEGNGRLKIMIVMEPESGVVER